MLKTFFSPILLSSAFLLCAGAVSANDVIEIPLPDSTTMRFVPVCVSEDRGMYSWSKFRVGDPAGGYKESPTALVLGGAFRNDAEKKWCYYLGETEVTQHQYSTIMQYTADEPRKPITSISWNDANEFITKYTQWIYDNTENSLPSYGGLPGYLRLPTEAEWEYAARGADQVTSAEFDEKTPYTKTLSAYEWFSGPSSSHNKVQNVRKLKPNPAGLYDMLGNVSEMTSSLYFVEYFQGRSGGYVSKGGHYLTDKSKLRSSYRSEQAFYRKSRKTQKMEPSSTETLGFRIAISSLVFPDRLTSQQLRKDWDEYQNGSATALPAIMSTAPTTDVIASSQLDAQTYIQRLQQHLNANDTASAQRTLAQLQVSLGDVNKIIADADAQSAAAWIKILGEKGFFIFKESKRIPIFEKAASVAKNPSRQKKYTQQAESTKKNIQTAYAGYTDAIQQIAASSNKSIDDGFEAYISWLMKVGASDQVIRVNIIQNHVKYYLKNKKLKKHDWLQELQTK